MRNKIIVTLTLACSLILAGCGTTVDKDADKVDAATSQSDQQSKMTYAEPKGCDKPGAISTDPVSFKDDLGREIKLDKPAQNVAVLEWQQVEHLLTLCQKPVGVSDIEGYNLWVSAEKLPKDVVELGKRNHPNMSALLETKPDLVILETDDPKNEELKAMEDKGLKVAAFKGADAADPIANMLNMFHTIAKATGREERANTVEKEMEESFKKGQEEVKKAGKDGSSFIYLDGWVEGGNVAIRPFGQGAQTSEIGEKLGLKNAWKGEVDPVYGLGQTDLEGLSSEAGDAYIFYTGTIDPDGDVNALMTKSPIWKNMPAVKEGRAKAFPPGIWTFGGPRSVEQTIDAYVDALTK